MANTLDPNSPAGQYQQQQAQQYGLTVDQLNQLTAQYPPTYTANSQGGQYGMSAGGSYGQNPALTNVLNTLQAQKQFGLGSQQQAPAPSTPGGVNQDPTYGAVNLGASALSKVGFGGANGGFAVYNPTPGQIPQGSKGGVAQVASPTTSTQVPNYEGPNTPGVMSAAPMPQAATGGTPTPTTPANAPGQQAPATPYATAPAAPGATAGAMPPVQAPSAPGPMDDAAHQQALAHAGMSLYSHFGGDPHSASPQDIMNFHSQLQNVIGGIAGAGAPASSAGPGGTALASGGPPPTGAVQMPVKLATGGMVPGRGNQDTVPALLTPGEYVIPKQQAAQIFGGRTPVRMADGGFVTDDTDEPSEARRKSIATNQMTPGSSQPQSGGEATQQTPSSPAPAAPGGGNQGYWSNLVNQVQNRAGGGAPAGGWPSQTPSVAPSYDMPSDPDPDWQYTGAQSAAGPTGAGGGTANAVAGGADIASGLMSGLQKAADTYAKSIGNWQNIRQDFNAPTTSGAPAATFSEPQAQQQKQGMVNPMYAAQLQAMQGV